MTGPGPTNLADRVRQAGSLPSIGISYLHPEYAELTKDIVEGIQYLFQTKSQLSLCISATGHGAFEAICCNLLEPGDNVLVCTNGLWGERFSIIADRHDAVVQKLVKPQGQVFTPDELEQALKEHRPKLMYVAYGESTGGTLQPLEEFGKLCHKYGCLLAVDAVASAGGVPLYMDRWEIDILITGSQKVLSAPPGLTLISLSSRAWNVVLNRKSKIRSYLFDLTELAEIWGCNGIPLAGKYHHTSSVTLMYALREALALICEEGLENCWARHNLCREQFHKGLAELGLSLLVKDPSIRLPILTTIEIPTEYLNNWKDVCIYAMDTYKVEIASGLGQGNGKLWRVGFMGQNARPETVQLVLKALREGLEHARKNASQHAQL